MSAARDDASSPALRETRVSRRPRRVDPRVVARFFDQLRVMLTAGVPVMRGLDLLGETEDKGAFRDALFEVRRQVATGQRLHAALSACPQAFNLFSCRMISIGDRVGYDRVLPELTRALERQEVVRSRFAAAVRYPVMVLCSSVVMLFVLLRWVLPGVFECLPVSAERPWLTRILEAGMNVARLPAWALALTLAALLYVVLADPAAWGARLRRVAERQAARLPIFRRVVSTGGQIQICHTLSAQVRCGVRLDAAMRMSADACTVEQWKAITMQAELAIRDGVSLFEAFRRQRPPHAEIFMSMIALGERTGDLSRALERGAALLEDEYLYKIDLLSSVLAPLLLLLSSGLVMGVLLAAMLPLRQLASGLW